MNEELCKLLVDAIVQLTEDGLCSGQKPNVTAVFKRVADLCKENKQNSVVSYQNDIPFLILDGFKKLLTSTEERMFNVQNALLDLFLEICSSTINGPILKAFLSLFKEEGSSLEILVPALSQLITAQKNSYSNTPSYCLTFPADPLVSTCELTSDSHVNHYRTNSAANSHESPWSTAALCIPLPKSTNSLLSKSERFAIAFWCSFHNRVENSTKREEKVFHFISVTLDSVCVEVWLNVDVKQMLTRIVKTVNSRAFVLSECVSPINVNRNGEWHFFCFNFREIAFKRSLVSLEISLFIDGTQDANFSLNHSCSVFRNANSTYLLVGYTKDVMTSTKVGNIYFFKTELSMESIFYLYCSGPDFSDFTICQIDENRNELSLRFAKTCLKKALLEVCANLNPSTCLRTLREDILVLYKVSNSDYFVIYTNAFVSTHFSSSLKGRNGNELQQVLRSHVHKFSAVKCERNCHLASALTEIGGICAILFFFAKVVEDTDNETLHSSSLRILLEISELHVEVMNSFIEFNGFQMINAVLKSPKCCISSDSLHAYISCCLSSYNGIEAVIISPIAFTSFVQCWKGWHKTQEAAKHFYTILGELIAETNPYFAFNLHQMKKTNIFHIMLTIIQDSYSWLQEKNRCLPEIAMDVIPNLLYQLSMNPVDLSLINDLINCILLLHKASNAYICYTKNSFYHSLTMKWPLPTESGPNTNFYEWDIISSDFESKLQSPPDNLNSFLRQIIAMLKAVVAKVPDTLLNKVLSEIIRPEVMTILAHNENASVREVLLECLDLCLKRGEDTEAIRQFNAKKGFHLLANQLHQHPATERMINTAFAMILELELSKMYLIHLNSEEFTFKQVRKEKWSAFVVLFALLPNSVFDKNICHNAFKALNKLIRSLSLAPACLKYLIENGIIECLLKTIINMECEQPLSEDVGGYDDNLIYLDVYDTIYLLSRIMFNSSGALFFQWYCNILDIISYYEKSMSESFVTAFRECEIKVLEAAFDLMETYSSDKLNGSFKSNSKLSLSALKSDYFLNLLHVAESNFNFETPLMSIPESTTTSVAGDVFGNHIVNDREKSLPLSETELAERMHFIISRSTEFIMRDASDGEKRMENKHDLYFGRTFLHFLVINVEYLMQYSKRRRYHHFWYSVLNLCVDTLRFNLHQCIVFFLSRVDSGEEARFVSSFFCRHIEVMKSLPKMSSKIILPLEYFLKDLIAFDIPIEEKNDLEELLRIIETIRVKRRINAKSYKDVISDWFNDLEKENQAKRKSNAENEERVTSRLDDMVSSVTEHAMSVTREFVEAQNRERKQFFNHIKQTNSLNYSIKKAWKVLVTTFYHEKSVWYYKEAFPQHWELDPTEGPMRIRRRLKRCFLDIDKKFFHRECKTEKRKNLLCYLFEKDKCETDSSAFIDRIHTNERIIFTSPCTVITPAEEYPGEALIATSCVHFVGEQKNVTSDSSVIAEVWMFDEIKEVNKCRFQLQNNAVEIFFTNGLTFLLAFETKNNCDEFFDVLINRNFLNLPNLTVDRSLVEVIQLWRERRVTNFEYLTYLNKLAGRSFNDLMQYPVFPFVLSDYESQTLDLESQSSFRKLNRPMAVQKKSKEEYYVNQYNYLEAEYERTRHLGELLLPTTGPYHYGSHYSNSGTVLHFLVRLPPFTQMFLNYQDNNFDIPDRTFHSLSTSWKLSSGDSTTDFKELIPEFFFLPEFLVNSEKFNFGVRQNNAIVDDVNLSNWCRNDPRLFILIHRQVLESDFVTEHLNEWIDLVFGYKQSGKAAIETINVFHPATYYGVDASKISDPLKRRALQTMTKTFGQMPKQLFSCPHPTAYPKTRKKSDFPAPFVIREVIGLKWGTFVFSPSENEPVIVYKKIGYSKVTSLVTVITNDVFGLSKNTCLLLNFGKQKGGPLMNATFVSSSSLISWGHPDGIIRVKYQRDSYPIPFISANSNLNKVSVCCSVPGCNVLVVGYESGSLAIYPFKSSVKISRIKSNIRHWLHGHSGAVSVVSISKEFSVIVSGGNDGLCLLWDLNKYNYIRTVTEHDNRIKLLAISPTLGDVASVSDFGKGSTFKVHTINGAVVRTVDTEVTIESICYSSAPEGLSVNVIATGFSDGTIQLWSSWDLTSVRVISTEAFTKPVKCITFSTDSQSFYAVDGEGTLVVWTIKDRDRKGNYLPHLFTYF